MVGSTEFFVNSIVALCSAVLHGLIDFHCFGSQWAFAAVVCNLMVESCKTIFTQTAKSPPSPSSLLSLAFVSRHLHPPLTLSLRPLHSPPAPPAKAPSHTFPVFTLMALVFSLSVHPDICAATVCIHEQLLVLQMSGILVNTVKQVCYCFNALIIQKAQRGRLLRCEIASFHAALLYMLFCCSYKR